MILYSKEPQYFASICQLIVTLYWICTIWVRECVIGLIYLILMYLRVPHFFMIDVDCGAQALPIIAISTLNPSHISYPWYVFFLYIVVCSIMTHTAISIHTVRFCTQKVTTKTDVVGCHVGQRPSSTNRNRSTILVDCCVNAILPLLSSMGSFTAKMVVLERVCVVPTLTQNMFPCWS